MSAGNLSAYRLSLPYRSAWYTVVLPTMVCLGVWAGLALGVPAFLGWNIPGWVGVLLCLGGFVPGLAAAVVTYPFLLRLAERGRGEVVLEGDRLRWRTGCRWHTVDFSQPHRARVAAGHSGLREHNASIRFYPGGEEIHLLGARRDDILRLFPEPYFVDEMAVLPAEGSWGFVLSADDSAAVRFFAALLECLWRNRRQNELFCLYQKFPWHHYPQPAFRHIRVIDLQSEQDQAFVEDLKTQVLSSLGYVQATPDYLIGWLYHSLHSKLSGLPDGYTVMPLGFIAVEVSFPRPDWQPFVVGHVLKQAGAAAVEAAASSGGPYLESHRYLYVQGRGEDGASLELAFDWYGPGDEDYEEAEFLVRFVQAMRDKVRR